ncbi:TolC family protein, partial [Prevotella sp.]
MKKKILILALLASVSVAQAQTLDECQRAAEKHYPIIKRYDLIAKTTDLTVKNIQKGWLPQVTAAAQATYQSAVAAWPDHLQSMFQQVGLKMKGLRKDQYKLSIDVQQPIYDGGAISGQRKIASQEGKVQEAENEV